MCPSLLRSVMLCVMNILYWNVCNTSDRQEIAAQTEALMREYSIDVACLQEVPYETHVIDGRAVQ